MPLELKGKDVRRNTRYFHPVPSPELMKQIEEAFCNYVRARTNDENVVLKEWTRFNKFFIKVVTRKR